MSVTWQAYCVLELARQQALQWVDGVRQRDYHSVRELTVDELPFLLGASALNLLRRGADGSLRLSADRWRLAEIEADAIVLRSLPTGQPEDDEEQILRVPLSRINRLTWDQLPRQCKRSQVRLHLKGGDLWTLSGELRFKNEE